MIFYHCCCCCCFKKCQIENSDDERAALLQVEDFVNVELQRKQASFFLVLSFYFKEALGDGGFGSSFYWPGF